MKKVLMVIVLLLCAAISPVVAQTAQEQAVLKVARSETEAWLNNDFTTWKTFFIQNEKTNTAYTGKNFYLPVVGWSKFSALMEDQMKTQGKPSRYNKLAISNVIYNVSDKMATLVYDQSLSSDKVDTLPATSTREHRTLIKENDKWKIASIVSYDTVSYASTRPAVVENDINAIGYRFLFAKKIDKAIEVFKFNVQMYPNAWNPYDSLGEAYAAAGNKKLAILNYEKSVQLNPKNENGKKILLQLRSGGTAVAVAADKIQ